MTDMPDEANDPIRIIAQAVIRIEGVVVALTENQAALAANQATLIASVDRIATRLEQIVGMIQMLDTRIDRLGEAFVRHDHGEAA